MKKVNLKKLVTTIVIAQAAGGIGSLATAPKIDSWYRLLEKPFFNPPNWVFGPVWTTLFLLMGIASYRVLMKKKWDDRSMRWYWIQLLLNVLWSFIFFGMKNPGASLGEITLFWWAIYQNILSFRRVDKLAGSLLIPYLAWVSFATLLNAGVWWLN